MCGQENTTQHALEVKPMLIQYGFYVDSTFSCLLGDFIAVMNSSFHFSLRMNHYRVAVSLCDHLCIMKLDYIIDNVIPYTFKCPWPVMILVQ